MGSCTSNYSKGVISASGNHEENLEKDFLEGRGLNKNEAFDRKVKLEDRRKKPEAGRLLNISHDRDCPLNYLKRELKDPEITFSRSKIKINPQNQENDLKIRHNTARALFQGRSHSDPNLQSSARNLCKSRERTE